MNLIKIGIFAALITPLIRNTEFYFPYVGPKSIYFMTVAEIVFFLWVILALRWKQYRPDLKNPLIAAIPIFFAVSFISAIAGADFSVSFWSKFERMGGVLMLAHLTAFAIVAQSVMMRSDWRRLLNGSVMIAVFIGVEALFDKSVGANSAGLIGNDSFWGTYLLFNIFIALYLFISSDPEKDNKYLKYLSVIAFLIIVSCLAIEGSQHWQSIISNDKNHDVNLLKDIFTSGARAAKISLIGGGILLGLLWLAFNKNNVVKNLSRLFLVLVAVGGVALVALAIRPGNPVYQLMADKFSEGTVYTRIAVWEIAWKGFLDRPMLGWGPENFSLVFARYYNPCFGSGNCGGSTWFDRAHNIVADTLVETGILGLISYLAIFGAAFYLLWRPVIRNGQGLAEASVFTGLFAAYFVQNLTVFDMIVSYLMFYLCLAFIASGRGILDNSEKVFPMPANYFHIFAVSVVGLVCFFNFVVGPFWTDYNAVLAARASYGSDEKIELYKKSLESSPMGRYQIRNFFANQWISGLQDRKVLETITVGGMKRTYAYLADELEKSRSESPYDFQSRIRLGQLYNSWGFFDQSKLEMAEKVLNEAHDLSPNNQQSYWDLAQTRVQQKRLDEAYNLVKEAYDLYPGNSKAVEALSRMEQMMSAKTVQ